MIQTVVADNSELIFVSVGVGFYVRETDVLSLLQYQLTITPKFEHL